MAIKPLSDRVLIESLEENIQKQARPEYRGIFADVVGCGGRCAGSRYDA